MSLATRLSALADRIADEINALRTEIGEGGGGGGTGTTWFGLPVLSGSAIAASDKVLIGDVSNTTISPSGSLSVSNVSDVLAAFKRLGLIPNYAFKTADQSNNSNTTLADVTDFAMPMEANAEYFAQFDLFVNAAATTTGIVLAVDGPASPTAVKYSMISPTSGTAMFNAGSLAYNTALIATATLSVTVPQYVQVIAHIRNGVNAGDLKLRMRSEINLSNATILRGSRMSMQRIS